MELYIAIFNDMSTWDGKAYCYKEQLIKELSDDMDFINNYRFDGTNIYNNRDIIVGRIVEVKEEIPF